MKPQRCLVAWLASSMFFRLLVGNYLSNLIDDVHVGPIRSGFAAGILNSFQRRVAPIGAHGTTFKISDVPCRMHERVASEPYKQ